MFSLGISIDMPKEWQNTIIVPVPESYNYIELDIHCV
jgi:hypothetical protein